MSFVTHFIRFTFSFGDDKRIVTFLKNFEKSIKSQISRGINDNL